MQVLGCSSVILNCYKVSFSSKIMKTNYDVCEVSSASFLTFTRKMIKILVFGQPSAFFPKLVCSCSRFSRFLAFSSWKKIRKTILCSPQPLVRKSQFWKFLQVGFLVIPNTVQTCKTKFCQPAHTPSLQIVLIELFFHYSILLQSCSHLSWIFQQKLIKKRNYNVCEVSSFSTTKKNSKNQVFGKPRPSNFNFFTWKLRKTIFFLAPTPFLLLEFWSFWSFGATTTPT